MHHLQDRLEKMAKILLQLSGLLHRVQESASAQMLDAVLEQFFPVLSPEAKPEALASVLHQVARCLEHLDESSALGDIRLRQLSRICLGLAHERQAVPQPAAAARSEQENFFAGDIGVEEAPEPPYEISSLAFEVVSVSRRPPGLRPRGRSPQRAEESYGDALGVTKDPTPLSDRQRDILQLVGSKQRFRLKELLVHFPHLSEKTVRNDLAVLCEYGILARKGKAPRSYYEVAKSPATVIP